MRSIKLGKRNGEHGSEDVVAVVFGRTGSGEPRLMFGEDHTGVCDVLAYVGIAEVEWCGNCGVGVGGGVVLGHLLGKLILRLGKKVEQLRSYVMEGRGVDGLGSSIDIGLLFAIAAGIALLHHLFFDSLVE